MVPNGWSIQKLEQIATVERGKFSARPRNDPKYFGGNIPFVQTGDIAAAKTYLQNYTQTLNEDGLKVSRLFPKDTILITIAANIGDTAITSFDVACPDSLVAIRTNKDTDCFWLKLYLETCKDELDGKATQNAQKNINLQVLKPLEVLTPPYPEQRKIAQILSTWDRGIATTEKLIDASKQQKKALMQQLLRGKKRLVDPETGKAFEGGWEEVSQGDVATFFNGRAYKHSEWEDTGTPVIRLQNLTGRGTEFYYSTLSLPDHQYCDYGDLLYMWSATFGPAIWRGDKAIYHYHIWKVDCKKTHLDKLYMYFLLDFETQKWMSQSNGMGLLHITKTTMEKQKILLPSVVEQQKIASVLTAADKEIELLEAKLALLKQEKKALMQQLLTGKRRVSLSS